MTCASLGARTFEAGPIATISELRTRTVECSWICGIAGSIDTSATSVMATVRSLAPGGETQPPISNASAVTQPIGLGIEASQTRARLCLNVGKSLASNVRSRRTTDGLIDR